MDSTQHISTITDKELYSLPFIHTPMASELPCKVLACPLEQLVLLKDTLTLDWRSQEPNLHLMARSTS